MSNLRVGGLASGMDLESIISDLMKIEQMKLDKLEQQKTQSQWLQEAYHQINKTFANFIIDTQVDFGLAKTGSAGLIKQSASNLGWIKNAITSDVSVLAASAKADAVAGTYAVEVTQLASNWSAASASNVMEQVVTMEGTIEFTIQASSDAEKSITISKNVDGVADLAALAEEINSLAEEKEMGLVAQYDTVTGRFFIQTTETGSENGIIITDTSELNVTYKNDEGDQVIETRSFLADSGGKESFLDLQYLVSGNDGNLEAKAVISGETYQGKNAVVNFGAARGMEFQSNQFTLNNIEFDLKAVGETTITVDTDVDGVYEKIVGFVNQYNELVDQINGLLTEKVYRDYQPLTDEQKKEMSEKEIELWEEKAKKGLLRGDMYLSQIARNIRSGLYQQVKGEHGEYLITSFGITTEEYVAGSLGGKLVIEEEKLKEAIRTDVDAVLELLFATPDSSVEEGQEKDYTGVVNRIYGDLIEGMKQIINKAGTGDDASLYRTVDSMMLLDFVVEYGSISLLQKDISRIDQRIIDYQVQMLTKENQYWAKFTAMEKAINQMNAQAAWLSQQLGGGM